MDIPKLDLASLREMFPWPEARPAQPVNLTAGWLMPGTKAMLAKFLNEQTKLVIELGSWMGLSTRFILEQAPNAQILCIDHWQGSVEHEMLDETARVLPTLYDSFIANCWEQKDRILPLRMKTTDGLLWAKICALTPDLIYIDAGHDFIDVLSDLTQAHAMFPQARIVGDDFDWRDPTRPTHLNTVKLAVQYFAAIHNFQIRANRTGWTLEPKSAPVPAQ